MANNIEQYFQRFEKKYFITPDQQIALINSLNTYIKPDDFDKYTISNIYFDTDNWQLIRGSIEKPVYKEKLRVRSYGVPKSNDQIFIELKKKFDGIVYKRRITTELYNMSPFLYGHLPPQKFGQIGKEILYFQNHYQTTPKVFIAYDRLAFRGIADQGLRITFDTNIRWRQHNLDLSEGDYGESILPGNIILMEIKIPNACPLWLSRVLSEMKIFPTSFSKYGYCYMNYILNNNTKKEAHYCA